MIMGEEQMTQDTSRDTDHAIMAAASFAVAMEAEFLHLYHCAHHDSETDHERDMDVSSIQSHTALHMLTYIISHTHNIEADEALVQASEKMDAMRNVRNLMTAAYGPQPESLL